MNYYDVKYRHLVTVVKGDKSTGIVIKTVTDDVLIDVSKMHEEGA